MTTQKKAPVKKSHPVPQHQLVLDPIHFTWRNGTVLCGAEVNRRTLAYHQWNYGMLNWSEACPNCAHAYQYPAVIPVVKVA
jgi:hypothetical protein